MSEFIDVACTTEDGELFIDGESLHRKAYSVMDVNPLWFGPEARGTDLIIPGRAGVIAMPRRRTVTIRDLPMLIDGRFTVTDDGDDAETSHDSLGLLLNIRRLRSRYTDPYMVGDGTRDILLTSPDPELNMVGRAHVSMLIGERTGPFIRAVLTLSMPFGYLVRQT